MLVSPYERFWIELDRNDEGIVGLTQVLTCKDSSLVRHSLLFRSRFGVVNAFVLNRK